MEFPFDVPEIGTATAEQLTTLLAAIKDFSAGLVADGQTVNQETVETLTAARDLATEASAALTSVRERESTVASLMAGINSVEIPAPPAQLETEDDTEVEETVAVTAASGRRSPSIRAIGKGEPQIPADADRQHAFTMTVAPNSRSRNAGREITTFDDAVEALSAQKDHFPVASQRAPQHVDSREIIANADGGRRLPMKVFNQVPVVELRRNFGQDLMVVDGVDGEKKARFASDEHRLPGGSLLNSTLAQIKAGKSITAAAGWCAPSDTIWNLADIGTTDGILSLPELGTTRGGWNIPANGGPDFSTIWTGLGTTHRTEAQVIAESPAKTCYDIPCPEYTDVRLGVDYMCLTGGLLQRRGFPEVVQWFTRHGMIGLAHKINAGVITAMATAAGTANVIPPCASSEDALSSALAGVEIAIMDAKYRNRLGFNSTLEVVFPYFVLAQMRAAAARRAGVDLVGVTDQMIVDWFAIRGAVVKFVYDWQDAYTAAVAGPGGQFAALALPQTANFLVYPAGTFVKAVQPVVSLDTVYDSTKLGTNEYTAVFVEDGWAVLQMMPYARQYTVTIDPCTDLGCCPAS